LADSVTSSGVLVTAGGGTNSTATPTAGAVPYGTGTAIAYSAVGTTGQALVSAGSSAPAFGTLGVAGGGTGVTATPANGELLIGNGTGFTKSTLTAGTGVNITNASGAITIATNTASVPIGTDIAVTDYSLTLPSAIASTASATVKTQTVALDSTRELMLFIGDANLQAVVYDSSANTFGTVVLVRTATLNSLVNEFASILVSSSSVLVCSLANNSTALSTVVLSISGSTITVNTAVATTLGSASTLIKANTRLVAVGSSFVLNYFQVASLQPRFRAITVSGTTPTIGSELSYAGGTDMHHAYAYTSSVLLHISCDTSTVYAYPISVSGTTLTGGTATTLTASDSGSSYVLCSGVLSTGRVALAYKTANNIISCAVISVTGTVASSSIAATTLATNNGAFIQMQVFNNQAFIYGNVAGNNDLNVLTDTAGVATVGTAIPISGSSMVGFLSTGKVFLSSITGGSSAYSQYGISSGSPVLEKTFQSAVSATTTVIGTPTGGQYKPPLSGLPNSGNNYSVNAVNLSLRTSTGKTASMQGTLEFVGSIDGNTVAKIQQNGITIANNSVSDALSTATGWYVYQTLSATSLTLNMRKMVLS
jgi:hypothetical protein